MTTRSEAIEAALRLIADIERRDFVLPYVRGIARTALALPVEPPPLSIYTIRALIADDAYAMTFETMGQYRTALLSVFAAPQSGEQ